MIPYIPPEFKRDAFNCPLCNVYSDQYWRDSSCILNRYIRTDRDKTLDNVWFAICYYCKRYTVWVDEKIIHPQVNGSPPPHPDMPQDVEKNYVEARRIVSLSPRSAAALLRVSIENLVNNILGDRVKEDQRLYDKIGILVKEGLPIQIQQSLDYLRVTGNNAVHPLGLIDVDDYNTAISLFGLVNLVVEDRITNPKKVQGFYDNLPQNIRDNIDKRNGKKG